MKRLQTCSLFISEFVCDKVRLVLQVIIELKEFWLGSERFETEQIKLSFIFSQDPVVRSNDMFRMPPNSQSFGKLLRLSRESLLADSAAVITAH